MVLFFLNKSTLARDVVMFIKKNCIKGKVNGGCRVRPKKSARGDKFEEYNTISGFIYVRGACHSAFYMGTGSACKV